MRVRHLGGNFELVASKLATVRTFPHAYTTEMSNSETVNTGGAVINEKGDIVGVVTGRGMQTSKLYIARTDEPRDVALAEGDMRRRQAGDEPRRPDLRRSPAEAGL